MMRGLMWCQIGNWMIDRHIKVSGMVVRGRRQAAVVNEGSQVANDHFFILNLLILGMTTDSKRLPTEWLAEPASRMVSTLPVKMFSLPILKSTQLSFFSICICSFFRAWLLVVSSGESQLGQALPLPLLQLISEPHFFSSPTWSLSSSSSSTMAEKQGWLRAPAAVILSVGLFLSILTRSSKAWGSSLLYSSPSKLKLLALFWLRTSLQFLPGKALTPVRRMWKMSPRLNMSQIGSYLVFMSLMLMTSGATQPGVPQRTNRYSSASANSASPKSAMMQSQLFSERKMRFSGLRSRCMVFLVCISLRPRSMEWTTFLASCGLNLYLALTLSQSWPPSSSSTTMQRELSDSKTSCSFMQHLWLRALMISISLIRHSFPLSSLQAASFEKALMAKFLPISSFSARQTEAKLPLPIFFFGLNCSWKPLWFNFPRRISRQACRSLSALRAKRTFSSCFSKVRQGGLVVKENLRSKSKGM